MNKHWIANINHVAHHTLIIELFDGVYSCEHSDVKIKNGIILGADYVICNSVMERK